MSSGLAVVALAVCILKCMLSADDKAASGAIQDAKWVIVAWIVINLFGAIITTLFTGLGLGSIKV